MAYTNESLAQNKSKGRMGEQLAIEEMKRQGMRILSSNEFLGKSGELDVVAMDGEELVFVEVKTRTGYGMGAPEDAVGTAKQRQLKRLARSWIHKHGRYNVSVRFDVVAIQFLDQDIELRYLKNAFW